jgi:hypothetical protein
MIRQSDTLRRAEKSGLEAGRSALIRLVLLYKRRKGHKVTVVFDGWENGSPLEERDFASGIYIIYSKLGEKADDVIKRIAGSAGEETVVVTSDRDIIQSVERRGGAVVSPGEFEDRIRDAQTGQRQIFDRGEQEDGRPENRRLKKGPAKRLSRKKKIDLARLKKL